MTLLPGAEPAIDAQSVSRHFGSKVALSEVSLSVRPGDIHALLGPNGAGKTTLVRLLAGLLTPTSGSVRVLGLDASKSPRELRRQVGLVPSGDRSLYLRISGLENLAFFARLHGLSKKAAFARAQEVLAEVGLSDAARVQSALYSHGMQKRLGVARALLVEPAVLIVDEATHDLDPEGARRVRSLIRDIAGRGAAILWTTQRIEEIRGFCDRVTLLHNGAVRFAGSVAQLMTHAEPRHYLLRLEDGAFSYVSFEERLRRALGNMGRIESKDEAEYYLLSLESNVVLGNALATLAAAQIRVISCTEAQSGIEEAFLSLTKEEEGI